MSIFTKFDPYLERLSKALQIGRSPVGIQFDEILSATRGIIDGKEVIMVGTNNYLGLTFDEGCVAAAKNAIDTHGTGTTGSRVANGNYAEHAKLEQSISKFMGMVGETDQVFIDADSHACIYDATRLSTGSTIRFRHNNAEDLDKRLSRTEKPEGDRLVVVEGMYSMFGDLAPLDELTEVAHKHGALIYVDEAHSFGSFGPNGRGLSEEQGVLDKVDFYSATFSKSLASIGGFCSSKHPQFEMLRVSRPYMFTASSSPSSIASAQAALDHIIANKGIHENLWARSRQLHAGLAEMGFDLAADASPVIAIRRPTEEIAIRDFNTLLDRGVYVNFSGPPATPAGISLLRLSVSAAHTKEEIDQVLSVFKTLAQDNAVTAAE